MGSERSVVRSLYKKLLMPTNYHFANNVELVMLIYFFVFLIGGLGEE